jgi:hypothetical protein
MTRYNFEFLSAYQGVTHYRLYIDGKSDTRIHVRDRTCKYADGSKLLKAELDAFNAWRREIYAEAMEKHGANVVEDWEAYSS